MAGVDTQIVNVALPTLSRHFSAPLSAVQWTAIAYLLALAVLIPASGWIGERFGIKQTFVFALVVFTVASGLCGAAHSLGELIVARTLQGIGGGMMTPSGMAMLFRTFPPERRARVARTVLIPVLIGPTLAPILGGLLIDWWSWRWVFLINAPIGVPMIVLSCFLLPRTPAVSTHRLDVCGLVLSGAGLALVLYALSEGAVLGWASTPIVPSAVAGIGLLAGFAHWSLHYRDPVLRLRLLGDRLLRSTNIVFALCTGPFLGSIYLTPIFLQEIMHQTPLQSGATTFVEAVGVGVGAQTLGRLYPRFGPRTMAAVGAAGLVVYLSLFILLQPETSVWFVRGLMLFGGIANSCVFLAVQTAMFTTIHTRDIGHASAIYNTQRQSSIALNIAVLTAIVAGSAQPEIGAFHSAYLAGAIIASLGTVCAIALIRTSDARATMQPPPVCEA